MLAVDTSILVAAHKHGAAFYEIARDRILRLIDSGRPWAIPWPCAHEFYSTVTHPRIFAPSSSPQEAFNQVSAWLEAGALLLTEASDHLIRLRELAQGGLIVGPRIHDARIAAICLSHGVSELWTADRDFSRFPALRTRNPLVG